MWRQDTGSRSSRDSDFDMETSVLDQIRLSTPGLSESGNPLAATEGSSATERSRRTNMLRERLDTLRSILANGSFDSLINRDGSNESRTRERAESYLDFLVSMPIFGQS